ncbi:MAG TPA: hypothetical protein VK698_29385 [Kofleriaceae bacterium]|nr:hypothetical protein [Kofleriaceae bacterium]
MRGFLFRSSSIFLSGALALAAGAACGGDDDDDDDTTDDADDDGGDSPDAGDGGDVDAGEPDAAGPILLRAGTIAVTETSITNPLPKGVGPFSGGVVTVSFADTTTITVPPVEGFDNPVGNCLITVYDIAAGDQEPETVGEGVVTVTGTANGEFTCADDAGEYTCQSTDPAIAGGVAGNAEGGTLDEDLDILALAGANFTPEMQGMQIALTGFGTQDGIYPIREVMSDSILRLDGIDEVVSGDADATFSTFVGGGPIPNDVGFNFLDDGIAKDAADVVVSKDATTILPASEVAFKARGEGLTLTGTQPHEFPFTTPTEDVTFTCEGDGCGTEPDQATGILDVMVINGVTTDVLPTENDDTITMLPAQNSYATFQCSALVGNDVTIPAAGVDAILGTNPARVQITVGRFAAVPQSAPEYTNNVVVGHSLTGFTTAPPPAAN